MKAKQTAVQAAVAPRSLKDAGYQIARVNDSAQQIAQFVLEQCPGFLSEVPAETKAELYAGFQLRFHELRGSKTYRNGDTGALIEDANGGINIDVNVAMAYTGQAFGKMKEENPALHGLLKGWREEFQKYASNRMADLKRAVKAVQSPESRQRAANKGFAEAVKDAFEALDKRVKTAQSRGDTEADPVKFRIARDAFWKAYNA